MSGTTKADVVVRRARADDVPAIVDLLRAGLGEGTLARSPEVWRWKHEQNPFGASPVLVAEADQRLIALRAFMRWRWSDDDGGIAAVRAVDTVTHPDHQGQGLFKKLTLQLCDELRDEGVDIVFNTPNDKSGPGYLKMGWQDLGKVDLWARLSGPSLPWPRRRRRRSASELRSLTLPGHVRGAGLSTVRSLSYLGWRYADVPGLDYVVVAEEGVAVVVGRSRERAGRQEAMICEVLHRGDALGMAVAASCVRDLVHHLDVAYAVAVAPLNPWRPLQSKTALVLGAAGFAPVPRQGPRFVVRPLQGATRATEVSAWDLRLGDVELF